MTINQFGYTIHIDYIHLGVTMRLMLSLLFTITLQGCGGGSPAPNPLPVPVAKYVKAPTKVFPTSYENMKNTGYGQIKFPSETANCNACPHAYGLSNFNNKGNLDLFTATMQYTKDNLVNATLQFYEQDGFGGWDKINLLTSDSESCLHPRKGVVADFNQDGKPDIYVACAGWDYAPYPGESGLIILSQADGKYKSKKTNFSGYLHSATAADLNNDGYPDLIVGDSIWGQRANQGNWGINILLNNKNGEFILDKSSRYYAETNEGLLASKINTLEFGPFAVELIDVNLDGKLDLLIGYAGGMGASLTLNDGNNYFVNKPSNFIPTELGYGWALDFTFIKSGTDRILYINRTGDKSKPTAGFYDGTYVQKYNLTTNVSTVLRNTSLGRDYASPWTAWFVTTSDNTGITPYNSNAHNGYTLK